MADNTLLQYKIDKGAADTNDKGNVAVQLEDMTIY